MVPDFNFIGFFPDEELRARAYLAFNRLLDQAPYGAMAVAVLEKNEETYRCSIEIYTSYGPITARSSDGLADAALDSAVSSLFEKINKWRVHRSNFARSRKMNSLDSVL